MEQIALSTYDSSWPLVFAEESARISQAFADLRPDVEHIGSTSVPGLAAKPVIDIILGFKMLDRDYVIPRMTELGYEHWDDDTFQHIRLMFVKWNKDKSKRLVYVHATQKGGKFWDDQLRFRDSLRQSAVLRKEYAHLKEGVATTFRDDPDGYTAAKTLFVQRVLAQD